MIHVCQRFELDPGNPLGFRPRLLASKGKRWRVIGDGQTIAAAAEPFAAGDAEICLSELGGFTYVRRTTDMVLWKSMWGAVSLYPPVLSQRDCYCFPPEAYRLAIRFGRAADLPLMRDEELPVFLYCIEPELTTIRWEWEIVPLETVPEQDDQRLTSLLLRTLSLLAEAVAPFLTCQNIRPKPVRNPSLIPIVDPVHQEVSFRFLLGSRECEFQECGFLVGRHPRGRAVRLEGGPFLPVWIGGAPLDEVVRQCAVP